MDEDLLIEGLKKAIENRCKLIVVADQNKNIYTQFDFSTPEEVYIWEFVSNEYLDDGCILEKNQIKLLEDNGFQSTEHNFVKNIELGEISIHEIASTSIKVFQEVYGALPSSELEFEIFDCINQDTEHVFEVKRSTAFKEREIKILKITKRGQLYFEGEKVSEDQLDKKIKELEKNKKFLACFREAAMIKPSKNIEAITNKIASSGINVIPQDMLPPEWGNIDAFGLYLAPDKFRITVLRDDSFAFAFVPKNSKELVIYHKEVPDTEEILQQMSFLISSNRIIESGQSDPDYAFSEEQENIPSLHITILFSEGIDWSTWYTEKDIPSNFKSLIKDCEKVGTNRIARDEEV
ncbi:MAG: hypothetical protein ACFFAS_19290 [Promethearchaeota archaeon]